MPPLTMMIVCTKLVQKIAERSLVAAPVHNTLLCLFLIPTHFRKLVKHTNDGDMTRDMTSKKTIDAVYGMRDSS